MSKRHKILVLTPYSFFPPIYGGHERCFNLYCSLPADFDVTILALNWSGKFKVIAVQENTNIVEIPAEEEALAKARILNSQLTGDSWDLMIPLCYKMLEGFSEYLSALVYQQDLVILAHPWMGVFWNPNWPRTIYDAHNVEAKLTESITGQNSPDTKIASLMENFVISIADGISACSQDDLAALVAKKPQILGQVIPNGIQENENVHSKASKHNQKTVVFLGSGHAPNLEAALIVVEIARQLPEWQFLIVGGVSDGLPSRLVPNVKKLGFIPENELSVILENCTFFINPMRAGSGTHLKMLKAMGKGCTILTSKIGSRGLVETNDLDIFIFAEEVEDFVRAIRTTDDETRNRLSRNAYDASRKFIWPSIQSAYSEFLSTLLPLKKLNSGAQDSSKLESQMQSAKFLAINIAKKGLAGMFWGAAKSLWNLIPFKVRSKLYPVRIRILKRFSLIMGNRVKIEKQIAELKLHLTQLPEKNAH